MSRLAAQTSESGCHDDISYRHYFIQASHTEISYRNLSRIGLLVQFLHDVPGLGADLFRRNLSVLLFGMVHIVTGKELVKKSFSFFSCLGGLLKGGKTAEVAGLALEGDLGVPLAAAL